MGFRILALSPGREAARKALLDRAARLCGCELPLSDAHAQALFEVVRDEFRDDANAGWAVGIAFGEMIRAGADFEWVWVDDDDFGGEISLAAIGYEGICHPVSMIEKRLERAEDVNLAQLRDDTIRTVRDSIAEGRCAPRPGSDSN